MLFPGQVQIVKYVYFNASGQATPYTGLPPTLDGGEYSTGCFLFRQMMISCFLICLSLHTDVATSGIFSFQFVVNGLSIDQANTLYDALTGKTKLYSVILQQQFAGTILHRAQVTVTMDTSNNGPYYYTQDPIIVHKNDATHVWRTSNFVLATVVAVLVVVLL
jgi:hypothetical protein